MFGYDMSIGFSNDLRTKRYVLGILGKDIDREGYIIDFKTKDRETDIFGRNIRVEDFNGAFKSKDGTILLLQYNLPEFILYTTGLIIRQFHNYDSIKEVIHRIRDEANIPEGIDTDNIIDWLSLSDCFNIIDTAIKNKLIEVEFNEKIRTYVTVIP